MNKEQLEAALAKGHPRLQEEIQRDVESLLATEENQRLRAQIRANFAGGMQRVGMLNLLKERWRAFVPLAGLAAAIILMVQVIEPLRPIAAVVDYKILDQRNIEFGEKIRGSSSELSKAALIRFKLNSDYWVAIVAFTSDGAPHRLELSGDGGKGNILFVKGGASGFAEAGLNSLVSLGIAGPVDFIMIGSKSPSSKYLQIDGINTNIGRDSAAREIAIQELVQEIRREKNAFVHRETLPSLTNEK